MPLNVFGAVGRDRELEMIASFLELGTGLPRVLVLEGEAGIGKTMLWSAAVEHGRERAFAS